MNIYSIKNEKLGYFNRPIYCESEAEALSYIQNVLMSDADRALANLKADLALYCLGTIDFTTGKIRPWNETLSCDAYDYGAEFICSLEDIFNTIPEDLLKPKVTEADMKRLYEKLNDLQRHFNSLSDDFAKHKHHRKEILK